MPLQEIENRIARLERDPAHGRFARMTESEIEAEALAGLAALMAPGITFADVIAEMEASDEPEIREGAKLTARYFGPRFGYVPPPAAVQQAAEALANWRALIARGRATIHHGILCVLQPEMTEAEWAAAFVTAH